MKGDARPRELSRGVLRPGFPLISGGLDDTPRPPPPPPFASLSEGLDPPGEVLATPLDVHVSNTIVDDLFPSRLD